MRDLEMGRVVRALRHRRGWRQVDCAVRAGVHRSTWSMLERGLIRRMAVDTLRDCLAVLEIRLDLVPRWRGADLGRLRDATHAALQAAWKRRLERWGWQVWVEVSFNHFGERGRIDLVGWHPLQRIFLVIEVKSEIEDSQALLGGLDVKSRVAPVVARGLGIQRPSAVVPLLVVGDGTANRDRLRRLAPLFTRFDVRGRAALTWLRRPTGPPTVPPTGLLALTDLRYATGSSVTSVGRRRVRTGTSDRSVRASPAEGPQGAGPA